MAATITAGFRPPARDSTSVFFSARKFPPRALALLPLAAGLAAAEAIRAVSGLAADLRWPNDILIGPRKAGGILVEAKIQSNRSPHAVVGIGINVHQRSFPVGLATPATSLDLEIVAASAICRRQALLVALLKSLQREACALADPAGRRNDTRTRGTGFHLDSRP